MIEKLKVFIEDYSQTITIAMLIDLCRALEINPSRLIEDSPHISKTALKKVVCNKSPKIYEFDREKYLTCNEVAEIYKVKKITVWQWIRENKLNAVRTGREYRIRLQDIENFNQARSTKKII